MPSIAYSLGAIVRNSLRMEADHFRTDLPHEKAMRLAKDHLELIEVETVSYCNRTCSFCPNQFIDRRSEKHAMPEHTWQAVLAGLRELDYDGTFVWSRYSEPLSERRIVDRIREVRAAAPRSRICANTNGDYLNASYLDELASVGLNRLFVDLYIPDAETYDLDVAREYHSKFEQRIGKHCTLLAAEPEYHCVVDYEPITITTHARNIISMKRQDLSSRGGLITLARRTTRVAPCFAPYKHLVIDWDGSVVVCCQVRSDSSQHTNTVVGRIGSESGCVSLVQAYVNLAGWRESLRSFGPKAQPCDSCNVGEYRANTATKVASSLLSQTSFIPSLVKLAVRPVLKRRQRW